MLFLSLSYIFYKMWLQTLDVSMNDVPLVQVAQSLEHLPGVASGKRFRQRTGHFYLVLYRSLKRSSALSTCAARSNLKLRAPPLLQQDRSVLHIISSVNNYVLQLYR